ncbi:M56 family metallopeptidase [Ilyomonas limi]|uniref:M56 family metallopeptidase n=1 Tax=Ilyomonas limi TaxID=2575867 RepID=A0A4U3L5B2_9BACT|nr:M56 family metallopeptidase [Ilyomonas limi]TKK68876.1 M56 family metallopeptidase [Ilyomonas limi]
MQALSQSSFLQALGYAIANSLWQVALLWLVTLIINACLKLSSHNRYRIAITAQFAGFVWFVVTLQFYYQQCIKATADAQLLLQNNTVVYQPDIVSNKYNILSYIAKAEMLLPYLSLAYLCLLCVLVVRWFKSYRYTSRLKQEGLQKAGMDIRLFVQNMAAELGIKQKVKIYLSTLVNCPLTIGFLRPIILVPIATINHLTTQQLEAVLLHELAHIRRADYLINLLLNVIETILFFNPFTRLISKNINKEREHCCDDWVLQFKYNAPMYAEALLRIACLQASPAIAMKAEGKSEGELLWRVKRLLNHQQKRFNYSQQMIALVVTTCMLVSIAWLQPAKQPRQAAATKPVKAVVLAPMAAQINNPFFSPFAFFAKPLKEEVQKATQEMVKTDLPKAVGSGLNEAGKALAAVTPTVLSELDKLNADSSFEQATKEAKKELKKVKWNELKQLSPFVDSAFIINAVNMALDKNKLYVDFEKAKQSLVSSQQQMVKLRQQNLEALINQSYLNEVINNATTWINSNDFNKLWNENKVATTAKKEVKERKEKQRQQEVLLQRLLRNHPAPRARSFSFSIPEENECYKKSDEHTPNNAADQLANWTYTNPVYIEKAADAANGDEDDNDTIYSYTTQSQVQPAQPPLPPAKPLIQVVEVTNNAEHVSIIITIRQ